MFRSDTKRSLSDYIGDENQKCMRSNVPLLLTLTIDSIIGLNGGLKQLLAHSTNLKLASSKVSFQWTYSLARERERERERG